MRYLAMIFVNPEDGSLTEQERSRMADEYMRFARDAQSAGVYLGGETLQPGETATVVRMLENGANVTDGPYGESDGVLDGFYMLECENLDQAIEWAARIPAARGGAVEVRPVLEPGF